MMRRKQHWTSLSTLLGCRAIHSIANRFFLDQSPSAPHVNSSSGNSTLFFHVAKSYLFPNAPQFYANRFCSESLKRQYASCWNCNAQSQRSLFLVCDSCQAIQPLDHSVDYFQIFGLEKNYEIKENLDRKYKDWQKKLHPDLVHSKSEKEREFAAQQSGRVIDAYRTLSNPRLRAIYILKLEGVDVNEEETISEPQLLAEIMEIREAVEEAPNSNALTDIQSLMREKLQHWSNSFANAFRSQKFEEAISCIQRMTYYDRVNEEIAKRL
ncbi:iron-sulfur cluster co-chaperone protein HscB homolog [Euphorbia lathyris]|uniref:iron-sulfur cluster co-chaperone protein HscB homolog n=1 Tax=Euphorbia lathyris TaxID=212925 RepID=UPI0033142D1D